MERTGWNSGGGGVVGRDGLTILEAERVQERVGWMGEWVREWVVWR